MSELLPCPFCGGAAERWDCPSLDEYEVRCGRCRAFMEGETRDTLTDDWNRRTPAPAATQEAVERVARAMLRRQLEASSGLKTAAEIDGYVDDCWRDCAADARAALAALGHGTPAAGPDDATVERVAEAIYLALYAKQGGVWWAVETKDVWHNIARAALLAAKP
jgi:hypothetical protein